MKRSNLVIIVSTIITILFLFINSSFGTDALYISPTGNVGIGVTGSPTAKFEVGGGGNTYLYTTSIGKSGGHYQEIGYNIGFTGTNDSYTYRVADKAASMRMGYDGFEFRTAPSGTGGSTLVLSEKMRIAANGNVGIGTANPEYKLDVQGGTGMLSISHDVGGANTTKAFVQGYDGVSYFGSLSTQRASFGNSEKWETITVDNGNVGIGTTSPGYRLHVYENNSDAAIYARIERTSGLNVALWAEALGSGTSNNYGIYAVASGGAYNWAGYFNGNVYGMYNASFQSFTDRTPFYQGDALSEIAKISGKDGEIDHSTLPVFAHVKQAAPVFEESELGEISPEDAFETVMIEQDKIVEKTDENGNIVQSKIEKGIKTESKGFKVEDGKIVEIIEETTIFETETIKTTLLRKDVYFNERTGKVYKKTGNGQIFEKNGKVYQNNQIGTKMEDQRDIGAMVSILTVAVQQLEKENKELRNKIAILESK